MNELTFNINGITFKMINIEGSSFEMGITSAYDRTFEEKKMYTESVNDFYIGETLVTQELWKAVMGENPSYFKGNKKPVESVSLNDCQTFITKLNQLTGKNFRLPTEAEWEFAAMGGKKSALCSFSGSNNIENVAWYADNSSSETHDVKTKSPNELGLYDMSGNVWEICKDLYKTGCCFDFDGWYLGGPLSLRGGGWNSNNKNCRISYEYRLLENWWSKSNNRGFRLAL